MMKKYLKREMPAFSLMEVSFVLVIIGLLIGGIIKGRELLESARMTSVIQQIHGLRMLFYQYEERTGRPATQWGQVTTPDELVDGSPTTRMGGKMTLVDDEEGRPGRWMKLEEHLFTPEQAERLLHKAGGTSPTKGDLRFGGDGCLADNAFAQATAPACTLYAHI